MKITKIAQVQQGGAVFQNALDPRMSTILRQALASSGLSKQKVLPFLEQLFSALGDVQISKVKQLIESLQEQPEQAPVQQPAQQQPVQQQPVQQVSTPATPESQNVQ